jgi:hypothetical protein
MVACGLRYFGHGVSANSLLKLGQTHCFLTAYILEQRNVAEQSVLLANEMTSADAPWCIQTVNRPDR